MPANFPRLCGNPRERPSAWSARIPSSRWDRPALCASSAASPRSPAVPIPTEPPATRLDRRPPTIRGASRFLLHVRVKLFGSTPTLCWHGETGREDVHSPPPPPPPQLPNEVPSWELCKYFRPLPRPRRWTPFRPLTFLINRRGVRRRGPGSQGVGLWRLEGRGVGGGGGCISGRRLLLETLGINTQRHATRSILSFHRKRTCAQACKNRCLFFTSGPRETSRPLPVACETAPPNGSQGGRRCQKKDALPSWARVS